MNGSALNNSSDLLRRLLPPVSPAATGAADALRSSAPALFESQRFDELLAQAFAGEMRSDRPVQAACDVQPPLSAEQLDRLALAADRAEAGGAQRALMMIDGRGFVLDVTGRMITGEMSPNDAGAMLHIDSAMIVPSAAGAAGSRAPTAGSVSVLPTNPAVARILSAIPATVAGAATTRAAE